MAIQQIRHFSKYLLIFSFFVLNSIVNCKNEFNPSEGLIIDTDIGGDDAMAISMIVQNEKKNGPGEWGPLLALVTTSGNTGANNASRNAHVLLNTLNISVPVVEGSLDALAGYVEPTYYFGYDGFGDFLPPLNNTESGNIFKAAIFLAETVRRNPGNITLLCIAPLTNLALALHINPKLVEQVRHIFILGGDYQGTGDLPNKPGVEANMYSDPDAAAYFFKRYSSPDKVTLVPNEAVLSVTYSMYFRMNKLGKIKGDLIQLLNKGERVGNIHDGNVWYPYDQSAAALLLDPKVATASTLARVVVETEGSKGAMLAELNSTTSNVNIITKLNRKILANLLMTNLKS